MRNGEEVAGGDDCRCGDDRRCGGYWFCFIIDLVDLLREEDNFEGIIYLFLKKIQKH